MLRKCFNYQKRAPTTIGLSASPSNVPFYNDSTLRIVMTVPCSRRLEGGDKVSSGARPYVPVLTVEGD